MAFRPGVVITIRVENFQWFDDFQPIARYSDRRSR
jgi:hypothetical protein